MTYEEFKQAWVEALRESMLPCIGVELVEEFLGLRSMERVVKSFVEPFGGQHAEPFHVTAALAYRWDALQTARTATTEDLLGELLGREGSRKPRTAHPWLRVDVTLRASTQSGKELALPPPHAWQRWARETLGRLENIEPLLPAETVRDGRSGLLPEILAWQSEPELRVLCSPAGELKLRSVEVAAWQAIEVPRMWDDPDRRPDKRPDAQLAAMFKRLRAALNAWMEALDHLTPAR